MKAIPSLFSEDARPKDVGRQSADRIRLLISPLVWFRWWKAWKTPPVFAWVLAAKNYREGNFLIAERLYSRGIARHPKHPAIHSAKLDRAYCLYRLCRPERAARILEKLVDEARQMRRALLLLSRIYLFRGMEARSHQIATKCLSLYPKDIKALCCFLHSGIRMAESQSKLLETVCTLRGAKMLLDLEDSRCLMIDTAIADYELHHGDSALGEQILARVLATGRGSGEAIILRARKLLENNRHLLARDLFARVIRADNADPRPLRYLAESYLATPKEHSAALWAKQCAIEACKLSGWNDAACLQVLARAFRLCGESDAADLTHRMLRELILSRQLQIEEIKSIGGQIERLRSL